MSLFEPGGRPSPWGVTGDHERRIRALEALENCCEEDVSTWSEVVSSFGSDLIAWWKMGASSGDQPDFAQNPLGDKPLVRQAGSTVGTYDVAGCVPATQDDGAFEFNFNQNDLDSPGEGDWFEATDVANNRWNFGNLTPFCVFLLYKPKSGWLLPSDAAGVIGTTESNGTSAQGWGLLHTFPSGGGDGQIQFHRSTEVGAASTTIITPTAIDADVCQLFAGDFDGTTMRLYRDGLLVASAASSVNCKSLNTIRAGMGVFTGVAGTERVRYIYGTEDEIVLVNRALSEEEHLVLAAAAGLADPPDTSTMIVYLNGA